MKPTLFLLLFTALAALAATEEKLNQRFTLRDLRQSPGFTAVAVLTFGLGLELKLAYALSRPRAPLMSPGTTADPVSTLAWPRRSHSFPPAASWLPARRAARTDLVVALRYD